MTALFKSYSARKHCCRTMSVIDSLVVEYIRCTWKVSVRGYKTCLSYHFLLNSQCVGQETLSSTYWLFQISSPMKLWLNKFSKLNYSFKWHVVPRNSQQVVKTFTEHFTQFSKRMTIRNYFCNKLWTVCPAREYSHV